MADIPTIASCTYANTVLPPSVFGLVSDKSGFDTTDFVAQVVRDSFNLKERKAKKVKERTEYLESAKIRDLKMVVVNIATF